MNTSAHDLWLDPSRLAFTPSETAEILKPYYPHLHAQLIREWIANGRLTATRAPGKKGRWYISRKQIQELIDEAESVGIIVPEGKG